MSKLISGKEALIALANGEEVLFRNKSTGDTNHAKYQTAECIQNGYYEYCGERIYIEFFIKPRTITINGVEYIDKQGAYEAFMEVYNEMDIHPDI